MSDMLYALLFCIGLTTAVQFTTSGLREYRFFFNFLGLICLRVYLLDVDFVKHCQLN